MDTQIISGVITAVLLLFYLGLFAWAWSRKRRPDFEQAANLPFLDEPIPGKPLAGRGQGGR